MAADNISRQRRNNTFVKRVRAHARAAKVHLRVCETPAVATSGWSDALWVDVCGGRGHGVLRWARSFFRIALNSDTRTSRRGVGTCPPGSLSVFHRLIAFHVCQSPDLRHESERLALKAGLYWPPCVWKIHSLEFITSMQPRTYLKCTFIGFADDELQLIAARTGAPCQSAQAERAVRPRSSPDISEPHGLKCFHL